MAGEAAAAFGQPDEALIGPGGWRGETESGGLGVRVPRNQGSHGS